MLLVSMLKGSDKLVLSQPVSRACLQTYAWLVFCTRTHLRNVNFDLTRTLGIMCFVFHFFPWKTVAEGQRSDRGSEARHHRRRRRWKSWGAEEELLVPAGGPHGEARKSVRTSSRTMWRLVREYRNGTCCYCIAVVMLVAREKRRQTDRQRDSV